MFPLLIHVPVALADNGLDPTFGTNGRVLLDAACRPQDLNHQPDEAILVSCTKYDEQDPATAQRLTRYTTDGRIDTTIGDNGSARPVDHRATLSHGSERPAIPDKVR